MCRKWGTNVHGNKELRKIFGIVGMKWLSSLECYITTIFTILLGLWSLGSYDRDDEKEMECTKNLAGKLAFKFHLKIRQDIGSVMYAILEK